MADVPVGLDATARSADVLIGLDTTAPPGARSISADVLIGLEIHQQLDTPKLFCRCPSRLDETDAADVAFERRLRPTQSELGEVDRAALQEAAKRLRFRYVASRETACLVEMDEEPPHPTSPEALGAALEVALLLEAAPVDEVHVMRKLVIDGSNTSGFQRTSLVATGGVVRAARGDVRLQSLCLEEDAARKVEIDWGNAQAVPAPLRRFAAQLPAPDAEDAAGRLVTFRLDRLGIPLVEIATAPDMHDGEHAREVALALGTALRATGKVKRGIGTIRQDLNISVAGGSRVEVKGVQELPLIPKVVDWEVARHRLLARVRDELAARGAPEPDGALADVTDLFAKTEAKVVRGALDAKGAVLALPLRGFAGLLKGASKDAPRLGRDLAEHAKVRAGVRGVFHSDELPAYGITDAEVAAVRGRLGLSDRDAFVLSAAKRAVAEAALAAVADRARDAFRGVPEETRDALPDGTTAYLRPLPGSARMYPETDVPPFTVTDAALEDVRASLPEMPEARLARWRREFPDLGAELAEQVVRLDPARFEALAKETGRAKDVARHLTATVPELEAKGVPAERALAALPGALAAEAAGAFAKEALPDVLAEMARSGVGAEEAAKRLGLGAVDEREVAAEVDRLVADRADYVRGRGEAAASGLMGPLMGRFKGKVPGDVLNRILRERVKAFLERG